MKIRFPFSLRIRIVLMALILPLLLIQGADRWIAADAADRIHDLETMPKREVGLVLGCAPNLYFHNRIDAAVELFEAGKIEYLLVSGDNHTVGYDEATAMRDALVKRGVPADRVVRDFAGFSTMDSITRARSVFGQDKITIISQGFHIQRALFIAKRRGLDAVGYAAPDIEHTLAAPTLRREALARVKTVLDLYLIHRQPRFLGPPIQIGSDQAAPSAEPAKAPEKA